jgi:hypothetical protein
MSDTHTYTQTHTHTHTHTHANEVVVTLPKSTVMHVAFDRTVIALAVSASRTKEINCFWEDSTPLTPCASTLTSWTALVQRQVGRHAFAHATRRTDVARVVLATRHGRSLLKNPRPAEEAKKGTRSCVTLADDSGVRVCTENHTGLLSFQVRLRVHATSKKARLGPGSRLMPS